VTEVSPLDTDLQQLWRLLFDIVLNLEQRLFAHLARHGLTPPQFYVLKTLTEHHGRCRIGTIAHEHHLTHATMTGLVKRLESMSPPLVRRATAPDDGRAVDVCLTAEGEARFLAVQMDIMQQLQQFLTLLPTAEREENIAKIRLYYQLLSQFFPLDEPR
jgi:DNA-binding MarR family transcriptional regulator